MKADMEPFTTCKLHYYHLMAIASLQNGNAEESAMQDLHFTAILGDVNRRIELSTYSSSEKYALIFFKVHFLQSLYSLSDLVII